MKRTRNVDICFRIYIAYLLNHVTLATIDVNISELEYLAAHLDPFECRRLVAALHYTSYELPRNLAAAERKVDEDIPCIRHLVHWNVSPSEGRGKTHEAIAHRLQQLNRKDLADWLTKTTLRQLGKDLDRALDRPFQELGEIETETPVPTTEPMKETEETAWLEIDTILMIALLASLGILILLIAAIVLHKIKMCLHERKYKYPLNIPLHYTYPSFCRHYPFKAVIPVHKFHVSCARLQVLLHEGKRDSNNLRAVIKGSHYNSTPRLDVNPLSRIHFPSSSCLHQTVSTSSRNSEQPIRATNSAKKSIVAISFLLVYCVE